MRSFLKYARLRPLLRGGFNLRVKQDTPRDWAVSEIEGQARSRRMGPVRAARRWP